MTTKTYQYNNGFTKYQAVVLVDGKQRSIDFTGGRQVPYTGGKFTTSDEPLQKAIESRKDFGTNLIILHETTDKKKEEETKHETIKTTEAEKQPETKENIVTGVTNMQSARSWLAKNIEGVTFAMLPNKQAVIAMMNKQTPPVIFPDWNT